MWKIWKVWRHLLKQILLDDGTRLSIREYRLLTKCASKHKDYFLTIKPIYKEVSKLFILTYREKKIRYPQIKDKPENIFLRCKYAILDSWCLFDIQTTVSPEIEEIVNRLTPASFPSVENLSELYRFNSNISQKQADFLIKNGNIGIEQFYERISLITEAENRVTASREIWLQAYRFLASRNRTYSLMCYLQYLNVKTYSNTFKHISIAHKYIKLLFKNSMQKEYFDEICKQLLTSRDLAKAFESLEKLLTERKKIELNPDAIKEVGKEQSEVAKVLGQYLSEDEIIQEKPTLPEDIQQEIEIIELFVSNSFRLSKQAVILFAQERKLFYSQLIQQINEVHYDVLDDLLIEESEEEYIMSKEYYKLIQQQ